jgi:4-hydroxyphenylpyruvate dioxygenase
MNVLTNPASTDTFPINGTDHLELYVGNAKQSAMYYMAALGFELVAYCGPETGVFDRVSYVLQQEKVRIVLTASLQPDTDIARHVSLHGDGVKVLALWVDDAEQAWRLAVERGAEPAFEPIKQKDQYG